MFYFFFFNTQTSLPLSVPDLYIFWAVIYGIFSVMISFLVYWPDVGAKSIIVSQKNSCHVSRRVTAGLMTSFESQSEFWLPRSAMGRDSISIIPTLWCDGKSGACETILCPPSWASRVLTPRFKFKGLCHSFCAYDCNITWHLPKHTHWRLFLLKASQAFIIISGNVRHAPPPLEVICDPLFCKLIFMTSR